jgi:hypothetical protein
MAAGELQIEFASGDFGAVDLDVRPIEASE